MTREELKKLHVAVVSGGWSDEHEIAMESGKQCAAALKEAGFTSVDLLDVAEKDFVVTLAQGGYDVVYVAMHGRFVLVFRQSPAQRYFRWHYPSVCG